jgi:hypothetical protein
VRVRPGVGHAAQGDVGRGTGFGADASSMALGHSLVGCVGRPVERAGSLVRARWRAERAWERREKEGEREQRREMRAAAAAGCQG